MHIDYSINNPTCSKNNGSIIIDAIVFNGEELFNYGNNYTIEWSENIPLSKIGTNNLVARNLDAGDYGFRIYGNGRYGEWTHIVLVKSDPLQIINISESHTDVKLKNLNIEFSGGTAPYIISYSKYTISTSSTTISMPITEDCSGAITITDSNNCIVKSDNIITILFPVINFSLIDQKNPIIYDDVLESFKFSIFYHHITDYTIKLVSVDAEELIIDSKYKYLQESNIDYYELKSVVYPGDYTLQVLDKNNYLIFSEHIKLFNRYPLKANIDVVNDSTVGSSFICPVLPILDSILIPYDLVQHDDDIWKFICGLKPNLIIEIYINNVKYVQKIINHSYIADKTNKNSIDWAKLSESTSEWFFAIQISNGINLADNPTHLTDTITLKTNNKHYLIQQGMSDSISQNISLVRKNLIISSNNKISLQNCKNIALVSNETSSCEIVNIKNLYNSYSVGSVISVSLPNNIQILKTINNFTHSLSCYSLDNITHTGNISVNLQNYSMDEHTIKYRYAGKNNILEQIYRNNKVLNANRASFLRSGVYILDISDKAGNKLKYINNQSYDNHYKEATAQAKSLNIPFDYGQVLINILDNNSNEPNIPGIEQSVIVKQQNIVPKFSIQKISTEIVSSNNLENSLQVIIQPANTPCIIKGPNDFIRRFTGQTQFIKLPIGVYTICGEEEFLHKNYLLQDNKTAIIGPDSKEYVTILFDSYFNKCIIGK